MSTCISSRMTSTKRSKLLRNAVIISRLRCKLTKTSLSAEANKNSTKLDSDFLEAFTNSYAASRPTAPPSDATRGKISASETSFAIMYERSKHIIARAFEIIENFETANEKTVKIELGKLMTNAWEHENDTAENVISAGHIAGLQKYESLAEGAGEPEIDGDLVVYVGAIYKQEIHAVGWGRMARKQEKALKKVDKNLAMEIIA